MAHSPSGYSSEPDARGMWLRSRSAPERFPTFAGELPVMSATDDDLTLSDEETEEAPRRPQVPVVGQPLQNREGATVEPAPRRGTLRPRPSPLFGEGELDAPYPMRNTLHMQGRRRTLWETEVTDAGAEPSDGDLQAEPLPAIGDDDSITLEVDPQWRAQIARIDAEHAAQTARPTVPSTFLDLEVIEGEVGYTSGAHPRDAQAFSDTDPGATDDIPMDDLVYDVDDYRNRRRSQTPHPSPLPATSEPEVAPPLAARAPAPMRSHGPLPSPVPLAAPRSSVTPLQRFLHAVEAAAWFVLGAVVFSGTGASISLLVVAILFAG